MPILPDGTAPQHRLIVIADADSDQPLSYAALSLHTALVLAGEGTLERAMRMLFLDSAPVTWLAINELTGAGLVRTEAL